jgi:hypothetical protein
LINFAHVFIYIRLSSNKVPGIGLLHRSKKPYFSLHNKSFRIVTLSNDMLSPTLMKLLKTSLASQAITSPRDMADGAKLSHCA